MDNYLSEEEQRLLNEALEEVHREIPLNSRTAQISQTTSRFSSAIWYEQIQKQIITVAGVGGIGSYVVFLLARMKPSTLFIYDDDIVEAANMSGQLYSTSDIGSHKVDAIASMISDYADYHSYVSVASRFTPEHEATDIMICGFDNMLARKTFYESWKEHVSHKSEEAKAKCLFIDGRLAAEEFQIYTIQGNDERAMKDYETKQLFSDAEADATICSYKQTTFCANMIASYMVNLFVNFIANQCDPLIPRDVPYFTTYDAGTMYFKTEA